MSSRKVIRELEKAAKQRIPFNEAASVSSRKGRELHREKGW